MIENDKNDKTQRNFFLDYLSPLLPERKNRVEISRIEKITEREKYKRITSKTAVF
jgi:hypothetical protein